MSDVKIEKIINKEDGLIYTNVNNTGFAATTINYENLSEEDKEFIQIMTEYKY